MRFLLDTNVISDARRAETSPPAQWVAAQARADLAISVITLLELERGVRGIARRDPVQGAGMRRWLDDHVLPVFRDRVIDIDPAVARTAAGLHVPNPMPDHDALIAATALVHGLTLVTRNVRDFERTGVPVLDPWAVAR